METTTHSGRETAYERTDGEGTAVCYVHGSGADHRVWRAQLHRGKRPGVALDLSGHGDSEDIDADAGYEALSAYADDVLAVADETGCEAFVGNSLGGAVVLHLALERDVSPRALVLAGTGAKLTVLEDLLAWFDGDFERAIEFLHQPDRLFHDADAAAIEASEATMRETGREVTRRDFRTCHTFDVRRELDGIEVPTLALCGEYDGLTPPRYHEYLAEGIPDADLTVLDDAAHLAMVERPEAFTDAVEAFLTQVESET